MKYFVALSTVILAASAMPTAIGNEDVVIGSDAAFLNGTYAGVERNAGLAGFGANTRGGQGGAVWTVWDPWALRDAVTGDNARIVYVRGRIDLTALFTASPGVAIRVGSFKTIRGGDRNADIVGGGLRMSRVQHVIIQNLKITNALNYAPGERPNGNGGIMSMVPGPFSTIDALGIDQSEHVWIDHCELSDDPWNAATLPGDMRRHDGLLDITRGANMISVSNNIFRNHNMVGLVGNDDYNAAQDGPRLRITYYLNWFRGTNQRHPLVRFGWVHILNNLYTDITFYGIGARTGSSIFVERNAFINCPRAWVHSVGPSPSGNLFPFNNVFVNSRFENVPNNVPWRPEQFYRYTPMAAASVEAHVRRHSGPWG